MSDYDFEGPQREPSQQRAYLPKPVLFEDPLLTRLRQEAVQDPAAHAEQVRRFEQDPEAALSAHAAQHAKLQAERLEADRQRRQALKGEQHSQAEAQRQAAEARERRQHAQNLRAASRLPKAAPSPEVTERAAVERLGADGVQQGSRLSHEADKLHELLLQDARYLPEAVRAEMVSETLEGYGRQGLPAETIAQLLMDRLPEPQRATLQFAVLKTKGVQQRRQVAAQTRATQQARGNAAHDVQTIYAAVIVSDVNRGTIIGSGFHDGPLDLRVVALIGQYAGRGQLDTLKQTYHDKYGRDLRNDALALLRDPIAKRNVADMFGLPFGHDLGFHAFVEALTRMSYANADDLSDSKLTGNTGDAAKLLHAFGYTSSHTVFGRWGFQMRVFTPDPKAKLAEGVHRHTQPVVAFRGTEGVQPWPFGEAINPRDPSVQESNLDTQIGDFGKAPAGYAQYQPNKERIDANLEGLGSNLIFAGHSLGGALAQIAAVHHPALVGQIITFQSPSIEKSDAEKIEQYNKKHQGHEIESAHYRALNDVVPTAGEELTPGTVYSFERSKYIAGKGEQPGHAPKNDGHDTGEWVQNVLASRDLLSMGGPNHNACLLRELLVNRNAGKLTPEQRLVAQLGALDQDQMGKDGKPLPEDVRPMVVSALHSVYTAKTDPILHGEAGRAAVLAGVYKTVFD